MVTLEDVGREAGVSRMTVSNYLSGKAKVKSDTAERVAKAIDKLGYLPNLSARRLSSGRSNVIGFATVELDKSPFSCELAAALSDMAEERGYQLLVQQTRQSPEAERSMMGRIATQLCDGCILAAPATDVDAIRRFGGRLPLVSFDAPALEGLVDSVRTPCRQAARLGMGHMLDGGYRHPIVLGVEYLSLGRLRSIPRLSSSQERLLGCLEACEERGVTCEGDAVVPCGWGREEGYEAMSRVLDAHRAFDGVMCMTDTIALGAMRALREHGAQVPSQIGVMGFDGIQEGRYADPPLSTVVIDVKDVARSCLDLLVNRIEHHDDDATPRTHTVGCELRVGGTTRQ